MYEHCTILHVEDDDNDSFLAQRGLKRLGFGGLCLRVTSTMEAMLYLSGEGEYSDRARYPIPTLLLCDGGVTRQETISLLIEWIMASPVYHSMPIVFMTGGLPPHSVAEFLSHGVRAVIDKGITQDDFVERMREVLGHCPDP